MERLTKRGKTRHENGVGCTHFNGPECRECLGWCIDDCPWEEAAWSKLAEYEDTGLEPQEVIELKARMEWLCK